MSNDQQTTPVSWLRRYSSLQMRSAQWDYTTFSQRWYWLTPLFAMILLAALLLGLFWVLRQDEIDKQKIALYRDVTWTQQMLHLHLQSNRDELAALARELGQGRLRENQFMQQAQRIMASNPEIIMLTWMNENATPQWVASAEGFLYANFLALDQLVNDTHLLQAFESARNQRQTSYSQAFLGSDQAFYLAVQIPILNRQHFSGTMGAIYSLNQLLEHVVAAEIAQKYKLLIIDDNGKSLTGSSTNTLVNPGASVSGNAIAQQKSYYEIPLDIPGHHFSLRAYAYPTRSRLIDNLLVWAVVVLLLCIMWSLWSLMRHTRRRIAAELARDRLFNLSLDILCVMDSQGIFKRVNPACRHILGITPADLQGTSFLDVVHPDDRVITQEELQKLAAGKPSLSFENRCRRHNEDGTTEYRWLMWAFNPDLQSKPADRLLYAVAHDVTLRRARQQALIAETAFRRAMENSMLTGMRALDMHGKITYVNPAFCTMIGWEEKDLLGAFPPYPYWPPNETAKNQFNINLVLTGQVPAAGLEVQVMRKDGSRFDARMYVSPLIDANELQTGWMTSMTNITEPKRIRQELAAAQERFTTVLEEIDAAISVCSDHSDSEPLLSEPLLFANRYYRRLFGASTSGHHQLSRSAKSRDANVETTNEVYNAMANQWFEVRQRMITWVDGRQVQIQVATDITTRKAAEELARQHQEKVQLTSRLITMGEMASSLAHELNQPLTAIANYSMGTVARLRSVIERGTSIDPQELIQPLEKTSAQAERAGQIIRRIREFVKRSEPRRQRCNIRTIIADAIGFAEIEAAKKRMTIRSVVPESIPDIHADPILIEQVLLNLLKNGIDAMQVGISPAHIDTNRRALVLSIQEVDQYIEFAVSDRGPGIDQSQYEKLFEPFYSTKAEGMGMGLNICRSIIEFHHGRLWAENNLGGGCTFRFTLPKTPDENHSNNN